MGVGKRRLEETERCRQSSDSLNLCRSIRYETWNQVPRYLIGLIASPNCGKAGSGLALPMADALRGCGCLESI